MANRNGHAPGHIRGAVDVTAFIGVNLPAFRKIFNIYQDLDTLLNKAGRDALTKEPYIANSIVGEFRDFGSAVSKYHKKIFGEAVGRRGSESGKSDCRVVESLSAVIRATPEPTTLPSWATKPIEGEDVG